MVPFNRFQAALCLPELIGENSIAAFRQSGIDGKPGAKTCIFTVLLPVKND
jgi:hypothetical protein